MIDYWAKRFRLAIGDQIITTLDVGTVESCTDKRALVRWRESGDSIEYDVPHFQDSFLYKVIRSY